MTVRGGQGQVPTALPLAPPKAGAAPPKAGGPRLPRLPPAPRAGRCGHFMYGLGSFCDGDVTDTLLFLARCWMNGALPVGCFAATNCHLP